jgi:hypothetical protein
LTQLSQKSPESALLSAAAMVALHQRVGWLPETRSLIQPESYSTDLPCCSTRAARCLQQILQGQYPQLLPEWLEIVTIAGQRVPDIDLPALLEKGRQQRELRAAILPVLGQRGRWLAAQNPDWNYAIALATEADWETGTPAARLLGLQDLRRYSPDRARELLQTTWKQEPASDRAKFLQTLGTELSLADEPFLEEALGDRSKEVRRVAIDLLASLPNSRLCQQVMEHSSQYLSIKQGNPSSLLVQLPDRLDQALIQSGIEPKRPAAINAKLGEKAWWLLQLIGATPLNAWSDRWQMTPQEIIELTHSHEWQVVVVNGLMLAAKRQKNTPWLEAILTLWLVGQASSQDQPLTDLSMEDLLSVLPRDRQNRFLINLLQVSPQKINESLTIWLLRHSSHQWSLDLAQTVLDSLQHYLNSTTTLSNSDWELRAALREFARFIPVALTSEVIKLRSQLPPESSWIPSLDESLALLQFRQEMVGVRG